MKILFLTDNFPPEVNAPATRTIEHCKEWVKAGAEITVITCFPNFPQGKVYDGYQNSWKKTEWIDGIKVIRVWSYISANEGFFKRTFDFISFSVTAFIHGLFEKADIIIATSPQFFTALAGRSLSFWKRKPWIMEVRDLWPESIKTVGAIKDNIIIRYFEKEEKWCYRSSKKIVTVTEGLKQKIHQKGIPFDKIDVVNNGANLDLYQPQSKNEKIVKELKLNNKKVLGYLGTHGMAHKLDFILDCARQLQKKDASFHFLFIGNGAEKNKLVQKVESEKIHNVTMLDSVAKKEVMDYLSVLDAAIINLRKSDLFKGAIPSKIFEATAMQIPLLIGVDGEARRIVEKFGAGYYYEPENVSDFIDKTEKLFSESADTESIKKGCQELAKTYDRKRLAKKMYDIISAVFH
ncbi:MAG: glycosyltransferase family 4 protein [Bacteroidales bacterium]|nr:glycosyltransferase family 4 protein [Bacteroidales bacterium]